MQKYIEKIPSSSLEQPKGCWWCISVVMFISCFFLESDIIMRHGNVPNEIISITLKAETMKWYVRTPAAGSFKISRTCSLSGERGVVSLEKDKPSRITSDAKDRDKLRKRLTCIAPLDPYSHPADLGNVGTGLISPEMVNAYDAVDIGNGQLVSFEQSMTDLLLYPSWYWPWQWRER